MKRRTGNTLHLFAVFSRKPMNEVLHQQRHIFFPLPQRRDQNLNDVQAMIQVLTKCAICHALVKRTIAGGDNTHIHRNRLLSSHPLKCPRFKNPQKFRLHRQCNVGNLIQKQCPAICPLEPSDMPSHRSGESPLLMPKQLTLQ